MDSLIKILSGITKRPFIPNPSYGLGNGWVGIPGLNFVYKTTIRTTTTTTRMMMRGSTTTTTISSVAFDGVGDGGFVKEDGDKDLSSPLFETASTVSPTPEEDNFDSGDIAFVLASTALVFLMIPGIGFFYSGITKTKSALSLMMFCVWSIALVSVQWFFIGYSLSFSKSSTFFIGNFENIFLQGIYNNPSLTTDKISDLVFCLYQGMFAAITPALAIGASAERGRFLPITIFILLWTTFVYDFIACWTWNPAGWAFILGGLDSAGGTPVHVSSGAAALAYALVLGPRSKPKKIKDPPGSEEDNDSKPHNMSYVILGTVLLWFGWFGFNGGSALSPNARAVNACVVTNLSASIAGITWVALDYVVERKYSPLGYCTGALSGLVCITPGCGFVSPPSSLVFGVCGAIICNIATNLMHRTRLDDAVDVFAVHGVGGIVGCLLTGIFAQKSYAPEIEGGWLDGNWIQIIWQLAGLSAAFVWSFIITLIIVGVMNKIPGLKLRLSPEREVCPGFDLAELGYPAYQYLDEVKTANKNQLQFGNMWFGENVSNNVNPIGNPNINPIVIPIINPHSNPNVNPIGDPKNVNPIINPNDVTPIINSYSNSITNPILDPKINPNITNNVNPILKSNSSPNVNSLDPIIINNPVLSKPVAPPPHIINHIVNRNNPIIIIPNYLEDEGYKGKGRIKFATGDGDGSKFDYGAQIIQSKYFIHSL